MRKRPRALCWRGLEEGVGTLGAAQVGLPPPPPRWMLAMRQDEAELWGGVAWGLRWSPPVLRHPRAGRASWHTPFAVLSRSEVTARSGVPEGNLGPGRGARAEVRGADALGSGDPAHFPLTVHLPPTVAVCQPVSFCTRRDSPAEPG